MLSPDNLFYGLNVIMTDEQKAFIDAVNKHDVVFCDAPPGTGKTLLAVAIARHETETNKLYKNGACYIFNACDEEELGFRPGDTDEKEADYLAPLKQALIKINRDPEQSIYNDVCAKHGKAWMLATSMAFKRGINLEHMVIICEESQNFTAHKMKKLFTRIDINTCKVIVIGNVGQCDLPNPAESGFKPYMDFFADDPRVATVKLSKCYRGWFAEKAERLALPSAGELT